MELEECFELFDLDRSCTPEQVRQAHRDLAHVWHPDRFGDNPRLRRKAEDKLKEINAAYDRIMRAIASYPPPAASRSESTAHRDVPIDFGRLGLSASDAGPSAPEEDKPHKFEDVLRAKQYRPRRSVGVSVGKYLMIGFIGALVAATVIILNFLSKFDPESSNTTMPPASSELRKTMRNFEKTPADSQQSATTHSSRAPSGPAKLPAIEPVPQKPAQYYEIRLKSGTVILTDDWWEDEDMIMYRINHGTMGIERRNVESIVRR
jgi:DnaJ domain